MIEQEMRLDRDADNHDDELFELRERVRQRIGEICLLRKFSAHHGLGMVTTVLKVSRKCPPDSAEPKLRSHRILMIPPLSTLVDQEMALVQRGGSKW